MGKVAKAAMRLYEKIAEDWKAAELKPPTGLEAIDATRVLITSELGRFPYRSVKLVSGNRHTWARRGVLSINPDRRGDHGGGWAELVHDVSHLVDNDKNPNTPHHCRDHARIERRMQRSVLERLT